MLQPLVQPARVRRVQDGQAIHDLGVVHRGSPGNGSAEVVTRQQGRLGAELPNEPADVAGRRVRAVGIDAGRPRREVVAAEVGRHDPKARLRERRDLKPPAEPELRKAVEENDEGALAGFDVVQLDAVADLRVAVTEGGVGRGRGDLRVHEELLSGGDGHG
jgi:hypothetical protein